MREHPALYYPLFVNNMIRLSWEHMVQYLNPLSKLPLCALFSPEAEFTAAMVQQRCRTMILLMQEEERRCSKVRIVGPLLPVLEIMWRELADERSDTPITDAAWQHLLHQLSSLESEYILADLDPDCWLPVHLQVKNIPVAEIPLEASRIIERLKHKPGTKNVRDQLGIAKKFLHKFEEQEGLEHIDFTDKSIGHSAFYENIEGLLDNMIDDHENAVVYKNMVIKQIQNYVEESNEH
jgi:hypothetical protein